MDAHHKKFKSRWCVVAVEINTSTREDTGLAFCLVASATAPEQYCRVGNVGLLGLMSHPTNVASTLEDSTSAILSLVILGGLARWTRFGIIIVVVVVVATKNQKS